MQNRMKRPEAKCTNPEQLIIQISPGLFGLIVFVVVVCLTIYAAERGIDIDLEKVLRWVLR